MRRLASLLVLFALLGAAGADAAPEKHYLRLSAQASFSFRLEYGSDARAVYNESYFRSMSYSVRAVVVFDGSTASLLPGASMVIAGHVLVNDYRTQWVSAQSRKPVECKSPARVAPGSYSTRTGPGRRASFVFTRSGYISVSRNGLRVDPGTALQDIGCHATEGLASHGLRGGPSFTVSAPLKSRFSGSKPFSVTCSDEYSHPFTTNEPDGNHHSFQGNVDATVTLTPFPATKLTDVKRALRDSVGKDEPSGSFASAKDCLR